MVQDCGETESREEGEMWKSWGESKEIAPFNSPLYPIFSQNTMGRKHEKKSQQVEDTKTKYRPEVESGGKEGE